jgi:hypothetical protein
VALVIGIGGVNRQLWYIIGYFAEKLLIAGMFVVRIQQYLKIIPPGLPAPLPETELEYGRSTSKTQFVQYTPIGTDCDPFNALIKIAA